MFGRIVAIELDCCLQIYHEVRITQLEVQVEVKQQFTSTNYRLTGQGSEHEKYIKEST